MANESLRRVNTSGGNRRVFTWAAWVKRSNITSSGTTALFSGANPVFNTTGQQEFILYMGTGDDLFINIGSSGVVQDGLITTTQKFRDCGNWFHLIVAVDSTKVNSTDRIRIYLNGSLITDFSSISYPSRNYEFSLNRSGFTINVGGKSAAGNEWLGEITDVFFIDGQALTPDVFGFYKQGKGYISVGSTQSTDFRPGQWVPKTPRVIKTEINRRGGFGVNGFYLPMNDSKNFGADFHCDPNSIITLNEKLPQPRVGVASTAVGIGYTDALRADPYAANLVLALPFVSGGLSSGFGDYAPSIKGSGSVKVATLNGNVAIANTAGYYGSAANFDKVDDRITFSSSPDFNFGTGDFTIEFWFNSRDVSNTTQRGFLQTSDTTGGLKPSYTSGISIAQGVVLGSSGLAGAISASIVGSSVGSSAILSTNQWNHCALVRKTGTSTLYVNGVAVGINTTTTGAVSGTNLVVGGYYDTNYLYDGYLQDLRIYKGAAKYTGGFDVPRPYTPVGIATWRAVPDTTANNFATLNPLSSNGLTLSGGNLDASISAANDRYANATIGIPITGKWYFEVRQNTLGATYLLYTGIRDLSTSYNAMVYPRIGNTCFYINNTANCITETNVAGDIWAVAVNMDTGVVDFYKNGVLYSGQSKTVTLGIQYFPFLAFGNVSQTGSINFGQNPTFSGNTTAGTFTDSNSKGLFKYQPPSGFLALCEDNLPTPAISNPGQYFKTVLYTGTGASRNIVGVGFTPDLIWVKSRTNTEGHIIFDSVRGPEQRLLTMATSTEATTTGGVMSFDSDGYSTAQYTGTNQSGQNYVAWCWRAGAGTTSTNTNGSIPSVVSVNQTAGFSIVSWTASGSTSTIGHGLGKVPKFIIAKSRTSIDYGWTNYHTSLGKDAYIMLYSTNASASSSNYWGTSSPSTTVFGVAPSAFNNNSGNMIAYCWAEIEGFSKFGSYVGNGSADGPFVYCNFSPAFVLIKRTDGGSENWFIFDNVRKSYNDGDQRALFPNLTDIEGTGWPIDFLSNGFKNRYVGSTNVNGATYIFAAFAQSPFSYSNSK